MSRNTTQYFYSQRERYFYRSLWLYCFYKFIILTFEELDKVFMIEKDQKAIDDLIIEQRCISKKYLLEYIGEAKKG